MRDEITKSLYGSRSLDEVVEVFKGISSLSDSGKQTLYNSLRDLGCYDSDVLDLIGVSECLTDFWKR